MQYSLGFRIIKKSGDFFLIFIFEKKLSDSILADEALAGGGFDREELLRLLGPERDET